MQRWLVCAITLLTLAAPAAAQEQRGSIVGTIKDSSGAVLPGVSVTAAWRISSRWACLCTASA